MGDTVVSPIKSRVNPFGLHVWHLHLNAQRAIELACPQGLIQRAPKGMIGKTFQVGALAESSPFFAPSSFLFPWLGHICVIPLHTSPPHFYCWLQTCGYPSNWVATS
jgi:hypothetical protein